ncbi:MAG: S41 family peptidase [Prevotellaceae bacterium]|nr:S41 family peptidase [Candidatus Minthosoma caballi]
MKKYILLCLTLVAMLPAWAQAEHSFSVSKNLDIFNNLYRQLDVFYVDSLDADKLMRIGIDAMLQSLDPYTEYYAEEDMGDLKMMTTGKYGGIGALIRMRKDSTKMIAEPYKGMPAADAGLHPGDIISKIDNKVITKDMKLDEVTELLRGEPGTTFVLQVMRQGVSKPIEAKITRRNVKTEAIPYYGMLDEKTGYISFIKFTEGCAKEMRKDIIALKESGAKQLVLDLRNNLGGLLDEAVNIVNLFVPKDITILETKGKVSTSDKTYATGSDPLDLDIPLVVLVNEETASSAEIVSGSLQDLDRAVIIGSKTYGKGIVQGTRELPYNGGLKLTTSKYYIPSGRCVQAIDYKRLREEDEAARAGKTIAPKDSVKHIFHTAGGREVTEGSGIKPDIETKRDTMANIVAYLGVDEVLTDWGTKYQGKHATIPEVKDFAVTDADFADFKQFVKERDFKYDRQSEKRLADLKKVAKFEGYYDDAKDEFDALEKKLAHNLDREMDRQEKDIRKLLAVEIVKRYYYQAGASEEALKGDTDVEKAISVLNNSAEYNKILGK